jgi:hypothetical protein
MSAGVVSTDPVPGDQVPNFAFPDFIHSNSPFFRWRSSFHRATTLSINAIIHLPAHRHPAGTLSAFDENSVDAYPATLAAAVAAASIAARRSLTSTSGATHEAMEVLK